MLRTQLAAGWVAVLLSLPLSYSLIVGCAEDTVRESADASAERLKGDRRGGITTYDFPKAQNCAEYRLVNLEEIEAGEEMPPGYEKDLAGTVRIGPQQALYIEYLCRDLAMLRKLEEDDLYGIVFALRRVPPEAIRILARFRTLRVLGIGMGAKFNEETLEALSELPALREFGLSETETDMRAEWMPHIGELTELTALTLHAVKLTDRGLRHLAPLKMLRKLDIGGNEGITNDGLSVIAGMPLLEELDLWHASVTNAGLKHLADLKNLETLDLRETFVTPEGIKWLKKQLPEVEIRYNGPREPDPPPPTRTEEDEE